MIRTPKSNETEDGPVETDIVVLGGGPLGAAIVRRLTEDGRAATLIEETAAPSDVPIHRTDPADASGLTGVELGSASTVIVVTPSDSRNLLLAQLVRTRYDVDRVLVVTNEPERVDLLSDAGHEAVCATSALAHHLVSHL